MSTKNHLLRAHNIIWGAFDDEIAEQGRWSYNLKNWTMDYTIEPDYESVIAYKVKNNSTDWSDGVILEERIKEWRVMA